MTLFATATRIVGAALLAVGALFAVMAVGGVIIDRTVQTSALIAVPTLAAGAAIYGIGRLAAN
jgi:hypothetical protein